MKILKVKIIFIPLILVNIIYSQVKFSAGPVIGFTIPVGDYSGETSDYYNGTMYGLSGKFHFGAMFRAKFSHLNGRLAIIYSPLSQSGISEPDKPNSFVEVKHNLLTIAIGPEYSFISSGSVRPYIGADLLITSISGQTTFHDVAKVPTGTFSLSSATRLGLGIGTGVNIAVGKKYSVDVGARFNLHNLLGKSYTVGDERIDAYLFLNDDADPIFPNDLDKHPIGSSRSISTFQLNLAFLFDF
ncbi:MAG TPA: opacity family porin [Ignavibacteria bacterium]|jgi:opacity protein-like surface antigen